MTSLRLGLRGSHFWVSAVALFASLAIGCGGEALPESLSISGAVTADGKPGADLDLTFQNISGKVPAEKRTMMVKTDSEGKYKIEQIYPGEYVVMVGKNPEADAKGNVPATDTGPFAKYRSESPLRADVKKGGSKTFDFTITNK